MGRKFGGGLRPLFGEAAGSPKSHKVDWAEAYLHTKWHLDLCSHLAATDRPMGRKLGAVPFWGRGAGSPSNNVARADAYLHAKFHLDPSNRLATIHQRQRQTGQTDRQDRQRSDSIGRTVLQTVAQKLNFNTAIQLEEVSINWRNSRVIITQGNIHFVLKQSICGTPRGYKG